jgi:hypothetical protein
MDWWWIGGVTAIWLGLVVAILALVAAERWRD